MSKLKIPVLIWLVISLLLLGISKLTFYQTFTNIFYDSFLTSIPDKGQVVIVAIDDESLKQIGAWPWNRSVFAKLTDNLSNAGASVISYDVVFAEARSGDNKFIQSIKDSKAKIILAGKLDERSGYIYPLTQYTQAGAQTAFVNFYQDTDSKIRKSLVSQEIQSNCFQSLALQSTLAYVRSRESFCGKNEVKVGFVSTQVNDFNLNIRYLGPAGTFKRISLIDVLNNQFDAKEVKDKIVFVGSTIQDLKSDLQDNLFSPVGGNVIPGVEIHASAAHTLLNGNEVNPISETLYLIINSLLLLSLSLVLNKRITWLALIISIASGALVIIISSILFGFNIFFDPVYLILGIILTFSASQLLEFYFKRKENEKIKLAFGQYVNKDLLQQILADPKILKLGGEKRKMTILFSDVRGFTSLSEKLDAESLVDFLNSYLTKASAVILENKGTIDKFIGDAIMAFWNAPVKDEHQEKNAVKAALAMVKVLEEFNKADGKLPDIDIGIGINTGEVVVGNLGSQQRFDYSVLGDSVNLASRLEGLTKYYGVKVIAGEETVSSISSQDADIRLIDIVQVKGKKTATKIYQLANLDSKNKSLFKTYSNAFEFYKKGLFKKAQQAFQTLVTKYKDGPSSLMLERCKDLQKTKTDNDWQGVWHWDQK